MGLGRLPIKYTKVRQCGKVYLSIITSRISRRKISFTQIRNQSGEARVANQTPE